MRKLTILFIGMLVVSSRSATAQSTCHVADRNSARFIQGLNAMMDSSQAAFRAKLQMPLVTSSQIVLVSDSATCARAGLAADSIVKVFVPGATPPPSTDPLYVIRVGTSFALADLNSPSLEHFQWVFIFGPLWEYRGTIGM
jgi:hypothetical protein